MADVKTVAVRQMVVDRGPNYIEGTDISAIVQAEVDAFREVNIPVGHYLWTELVTTPFKSGGAIQGAGRTDIGITAAHALSGLSTRIVCSGNALADGAIRLRGSEFELRDFQLHGATFHPTVPPAQAAGTAILISNDPHPDGGGGLETGKHELRGLGVYGWTTGIKIGDDADEDGVSNDHCHFTRISFRNNNQCYWILNTNAMGHRIDQNQFRHENTYCCRSSGGGHQQFHDCLCTHGQTFFYFDGTNNNAAAPPYEKYRPGTNNALHVVDNLKVDTQHAGNFIMVEATNVNYADVHFIRPQVSGDDAWIMGNIDDGMTLTVTDPSFKTTPTDVTVSALPASSA